MESEYTEFKVQITQSLLQIETTVAENENKTKDRLCQLDNDLKLRIKNLERETSEMESCKTKIMGEISKLASTVKMLQEQLISAQKQNNKLLEQQEILKIELDLLKATRQQQSTCDQHSEEPREPLETNFEEPLPDQQTSFMTPTVPLSNKYEILEDHSEEDYQDIKVTEEYSLVQRSPHKTENNRQQERGIRQ